MKKNILFVTILILSFTACKKSESNLETFSKDNYTIGYPKDWELDTSGKMNSSLLLFSLPSSDTDDFRENVNVMIQNLGGKSMTIEQYGELSTNQIKSSGEILKNEVVGDKYVMEWKGFMNQRNLRFKQYYFVDDGKAYVVTFTAKENEYDDYINEANQILDSFKLTN